MPAEPQVDILKVAQEAREQAESLNADPDATLSVIAGAVYQLGFEDGRITGAGDMERIEREARADSFEEAAAMLLRRANEVRANVGLDPHEAPTESGGALPSDAPALAVEGYVWSVRRDGVTFPVISEAEARAWAERDQTVELIRRAVGPWEPVPDPVSVLEEETRSEQ